MHEQQIPKCPYCGQDMEYYFDNNPMSPLGQYLCRCGARAPHAQTEAEAYEAAMQGKPLSQSKWLGR